MIVDCSECNILMELEEEDNEKNYYRGYYQCPICKLKKTHYKEYDKNRKLIKDEIEDDNY